MEIKFEDIKNVEVNLVTQEVTLTFSSERKVSTVEKLTLRNPDREITYNLFAEGFEVLGSFDGKGLTLGNFSEDTGLNEGDFPAFAITFGSADSDLWKAESPRELAKRYHRLRFPSSKS